MADEQGTQAATPSPEDIAAARETLRRAEAATSDEPRQAMVNLVTMPEFDVMYQAMTDAQRLNPANTELSYAIGMLARIKATVALS